MGAIRIHLRVESDAEDTCFVVKIMEVFEDGNAYNIRTGITTLGYRNESDHRMEYQPNTIVSTDFFAWDIAWQAKKGSRIRIDVTSSDFPQYAIHPNYSGVWSVIEQCRIAKQIIHMGGDKGSFIEIPIVDIDNVI